MAQAHKALGRHAVSGLRYLGWKDTSTPRCQGASQPAFTVSVAHLLSSPW
jgi:hypothetical protein